MLRPKAFAFFTSAMLALSLQAGCSAEAPASSSLRKFTQLKDAATKQPSLSEKAAQAVFVIMPYTPQRVRGGGTGFLVVTPNQGTVIVTNRHVCETADEEGTHFLLEQGPAVWVAPLVMKSKKTDLCIIKPPKEVLDTRTGFELSATKPKAGEYVQVYGHPFLRPLTHTFGKYVNEAREPLGMLGTPFAPDFVMLIGRLDFMVFPGNSGSPLLNSLGDVVGVIFAMEGASRNGLFVPVSELRTFLETGE